jgi:hypothetical protein
LSDDSLFDYAFVKCQQLFDFVAVRVNHDFLSATNPKLTCIMAMGKASPR